MANELKLSLTAALTNGTHKEQFSPGSLSIDQATIGAQAAVVSIGTSEETIGTGDVGTLGWCFMQNLDATNYFEYGPDSTGMVGIGRVEAGEIAAFRLKPGITLKAQANTAAVKAKILILED